MGSSPRKGIRRSTTVTGKSGFAFECENNLLLVFVRLCACVLPCLSVCVFMLVLVFGECVRVCVCCMSVCVCVFHTEVSELIRQL